MTQTDRVLAYLKRGRKLTQFEAIRRNMGLRLGARVHQLRQQGYRIKTTMVRRGRARVAEYSL